MTRIAQLLVVIPIAIVPIVACNSRRHDEQAAKTSEAPTIGSDFAEARDRAVQQIQAKLADLDARLTTLKRDADARTADLTSEGKAAVNDAIAKLEQQRTSAQQALDQARTATAAGWEQVKQRTDRALKDVDDAYEAAAKKLRE